MRKESKILRVKWTYNLTTFTQRLLSITEYSKTSKKKSEKREKTPHPPIYIKDKKIKV